YLAEVEQAGLFGIAGFSEPDHAGIIGSYCPNLLFPYARQVISGLVLEGGFPPFLLQPINFDALYAEKQRRMTGGDEAPTLNSWALGPGRSTDTGRSRRRFLGHRPGGAGCPKRRANASVGA